MRENVFRVLAGALAIFIAWAAVTIEHEWNVRHMASLLAQLWSIALFGMFAVCGRTAAEKFLELVSGATLFDTNPSLTVPHQKDD